MNLFAWTTKAKIQAEKHRQSALNELIMLERERQQTHKLEVDLANLRELDGKAVIRRTSEPSEQRLRIPEEPEISDRGREPRKERPGKSGKIRDSKREESSLPGRSGKVSRDS